MVSIYDSTQLADHECFHIKTPFLSSTCHFKLFSVIKRSVTVTCNCSNIAITSLTLPPVYYFLSLSPTDHLSMHNLLYSYRLNLAPTW